MKKDYIITFSISVIVLFTFAVILLMLMTPQENQSVSTAVKSYDTIDKSSYTYTQTKDISKDTLVKEYTINSDDINSFEKKSTYKPGNADPFTPSSDANTAATQNNSQEDTTNSNGGTSNPPATGK